MFESTLNLEESTTVAINSLAQEKKARGERIYNLSAGEPMLAPHPAIVAAANEAIEAGKTLYPPVAGLLELRQEATKWMNSVSGANFDIANTLITCGGKFGIFSACQAFLQHGDEVLIPSPYWVSYPAIVKLFGAVPIIVNSEEKNNWKVSASDLKKYATPKTKMLILNNAGNPTGTLYARDELREILALAKINNWMIISDEVYSGLSYDNEFVSVASFPDMAEQSLIIQSCSKHFAMTGWRVGMIFGPERAIKILTKIQGQSTTGTSSISQWTAVEALRNAEEIQNWVREKMRARRDLLAGELDLICRKKIALPSAGLYLFFSLSDIGVTNSNSAQFCLNALKDGNIALVPGSAFGQEGFVRISFSAPEDELCASAQALKEYLKA